MTILLAPMEGMLDHSLRDVLTQVGGIDRCVSEFIRVTGQLLPDRVFLRICPELARGGRTAAGVPVRPQLLGSDPACLADNARLAVACAQALAEGGADELVVHARTRAQGYRPPAFWDRIADIRAAVRPPVVANGEIWNVDDARRCRAESGCDAIMLGRGMVADPSLARRLQSADPDTAPMLADADLGRLLHRYWGNVATHVEPRHRAGRLKQWLNLLRRRYPVAEPAFQQRRADNDPRRFGAALQQLFPPPETLVAA